MNDETIPTDGAAPEEVPAERTATQRTATQRTAREEIPTFASWDEVPRDLRPAEALASRGYPDPGRPQARVRSGGAMVELFSTSAARRLRDGMWTGAEAPSARTQVGGAGRADVVRSLARGDAPVPGKALKGTCDVCGKEAIGLLGGVCPSCRRLARQASLGAAARDWLEQLFATDFVVLDTETTGVRRRDEVIEVALIDRSGAVLLESRVWPRSGAVPADASRVHGLGIADLHGAPTWPKVLEPLRDLIEGRRVLAWNAPFDERLLLQSSRLWRVRHGLPAFECAMRAYALMRGNASGSVKLERAAAEQEVLTRAQSHRSADDARLTLAVLEQLATPPT